MYVHTVSTLGSQCTFTHCVYSEFIVYLYTLCLHSQCVCKYCVHIEFIVCMNTLSTQLVLSMYVHSVSTMGSWCVYTMWVHSVYILQ